MTAREWTYTVRGYGAFPIDMLRYDGCFPRTSDDSAAIWRTFDPNYTGDIGEVDSLPAVRLHSPYHEPTESRWRSFGWLVIEKGRS